MDHRKQESKLITIALIGVSVLLLITLFIFRNKLFMKTYHNRVNHFLIKYPGDWIKEENRDGAAVLLKSPLESPLDTFHENVNVVVQDNAENRLSLQKYTETAILQVRVVFKENIQIVESTGFMLAGKPGYKFVYIAKGPPIDLKLMHVWTIVGDKAYQVTYAAYLSQFDVYLDKVEKMIESFRIK